MAVPREQAIRVLGQVIGEHVSLDRALQDQGAVEQQAWLQDVCSGVLRWKGRIDSAIDLVSLKKKPSGWLRRALSVAVYQLFAHEQAHVAGVVSETVTAIRQHEGESPAKFANAALRKIAEHRLELANPVWNPKWSIDEQAAWASLPKWMWREIAHSHGTEWAKAYAVASLGRPKNWFQLAPNAKLPEGAIAGDLAGSFEWSGARPEMIRPGFEKGHWIVQDISNQMLVTDVCEKLQSFGSPSKLKVLDLCASPGGKSVALAWRGFQVTAADRRSRMPLLSETLRCCAPQVRSVISEELPMDEMFDVVWVDAPCMTTGLIRRHPDVRWNRLEKELKEMTVLQSTLLRDGWARLRPGGVLIYSVCSVLSQEGEQILASQPLPVQSELIQSWQFSPHLGPGGDGLFARMVKKI